VKWANFRLQFLLTNKENFQNLGEFSPEFLSEEDEEASLVNLLELQDLGGASL